MKTANVWTAEKLIEVLNKYREGNITRAQLAALYGLSVSRINEIIAQAKMIEREMLAEEKDVFYGLSVRARNCLICSGFESKEDVIAAIKNGDLARKGEGSRIGDKTIVEIIEWTGLKINLDNIKVDKKIHSAEKAIENYINFVLDRLKDKINVVNSIKINLGEDGRVTAVIIDTK